MSAGNYYDDAGNTGQVKHEYPYQWTICAK